MLIIARVIMGANIAGIYGAQIFRSDDRPLYKRGFTINLAVISTAIVLASIRYVDDIIRRRRRRGQLAQLAQPESGSEENNLDEKKAAAPEVSPYATDVKQPVAT